MKIAMFYYDGFAEFEIVLACLLFHSRSEIIAIALEDRVYTSEEKQRFCIDKTLKDVDAESIDLLIIPGGEPDPLIANKELKRFIEDLVDRNKKIGGICGGAIMLAGFGVLKGKRCTGDTSGVDASSDYYRYYSDSILSNEQVVVDGNFITAQGQAYAEFAVALADQMGLFTGKEDQEECLQWLKNIR
jgi:putative intracellular protease/amidase